jgi:Dolichyl-phosphate-mannose-protein mannosyltransferase
MKRIFGTAAVWARPEKDFSKAVLGVIVVAILLRVAASLALGDRAIPISGAADQYTYDTLAQRVVAGYGFSFPTNWYPFTQANEPTAHWSFLYTLYLAGVYALFGHHPLAARLIQALLSGINIWLAYRLGRRVFGGLTGLAAAALTAVYAYLIFFNASLMTQTFYITAVMASLDLSLSLAVKPTRQAWILLGLAIGAGVLLRQTLLLFAPILFIWLWWCNRHESEHAVPERKVAGVLPSPAHAANGRNAGIVRWMISGPLLSVAIIGVFVLPWTVRNYLVYHDFLLLNSNGGFWFYSSNYPKQGTNFNQNYVAPIPKNLRGLSEPALDRALYEQGFGFIRSDPVRFLLLSLNRTKDYFQVLPSAHSSLISNLSRVFSFTLYLPFMLYGLLLSRRQWRLCLPFYLYIAFDAVFCLISWSAPRYRLPSDAILMPFAGFAVVTLAARFRFLSLPHSATVARDEPFDVA